MARLQTPAEVVRSPPWSSDENVLTAQLLSREWLVALGNGGYASGTVGGPPSRRHHGLLIAALPAPVGRTLTFSHFREELVWSDGRLKRLWGQHIAGAEPELNGLESFAGFSLHDGLPRWRFQVSDVVIEKRVVPRFRHNTVLVRYEMIEGDSSATLNLRPMVQFRGHDWPVSTPIEGGRWSDEEQGLCEITAADAATCLRIKSNAEDFATLADPITVEQCYYQVEDERGYDHVGPLWSPGVFTAAIGAGKPVCVLLSTESWEKIAGLDPETLIDDEAKRRQELIHGDGRSDEVLQNELRLAADQFLICPANRSVDAPDSDGPRNHDNRRSVIAGYPWFTDWGRDTMISLPGLTLSTGRESEASLILRTFADYVQNGLIPNLFPEGANVGMYHTADATLWFFQAIAAYYEATSDDQLLRDLEPTLTDIVDAHLGGTDYGIRVDENDGLLRQGAPGVQLTWMDAKVEDWVVTPRRGKAVEINALWYNALRCYQSWMQTLGEDQRAGKAKQAADQAYESFNQRFWFEEGSYLYDVVDGESGDDASLRPNQLFAVSLPHPVLQSHRWASVVDKVAAELYTPVGLRSLAAVNGDYHGTYVGDVWARDAAYHQGTVWSWLLGPFLHACDKVDVDSASFRAKIYAELDGHMNEACIGQISEVFDGDPPHHPRGCFAQAWSIAEVLRTFPTQ